MVRYSTVPFILQRNCVKSSQWAAAQRGMWGLVLIPPTNYCRKLDLFNMTFCGMMLSLNWTFSDCLWQSDRQRQPGMLVNLLEVSPSRSVPHLAATLHVSTSGTCQVFLKEKPWPQGHNRKVRSKHLVFHTWKQKSIISCHQWDNVFIHNSQSTLTLSRSCFFFKQFCSLWMTFLKTVVLFAECHWRGLVFDPC